MKKVTLTNLRRNLEEYLSESQKEEITVTRYGKSVGLLSPVKETSPDGTHGTQTEGGENGGGDIANSAS